MAEEMALRQLVGSWRLVSLGVTYADTKERIELYGPHPTGYMVLSPNGRIMFLFTRTDRTPPQTDAERATLFSAMTAYTGHVRIEAGGPVRHHCRPGLGPRLDRRAGSDRK